MHARILRWIASAGAVGVMTLAFGGFGGGIAAARPLFQMLPRQFPAPLTIAQCETTLGINCYGAPQIRHAYGIDQLNRDGLTGRGTTIVIVDSFGSPTVASDLATFDAQFGLPAPPSLKIIAPVGSIPPFDSTNSTVVGWAEETSLDVEWAHAMAPGANILLVETPVAETEGVTGFPQIVQAENYVIDHHLGDVISQSFGATEQTFQNSSGQFDPQLIYELRSAYINAARHGVTVLAGSGDTGATNYELDGTTLYPYRVNSWPSSDPLVTSLGGTMLDLDQAGNRLAPDTVWNDAWGAGGGGLSAAFSRPSYQDGVSSIVGDARGTPDVSMSAAVNGGVWVYMSFSGIEAPGVSNPGWYVFGGTSEATPLFAGEVATADQIARRPLGLINPSLYAIGDGHGSGITDITTGNNTFAGVTGFDAGPGYDLASGLGTANELLPFQLASHARSHRRSAVRGHAHARG